MRIEFDIVIKDFGCSREFIVQICSLGKIYEFGFEFEPHGPMSDHLVLIKRHIVLIDLYNIA